MEMATEITLPVSLRVCLAFGQETCFISSLTPTKNLKKTHEFLLTFDNIAYRVSRCRVCFPQYLQYLLTSSLTFRLGLAGIV